MVWSQAHAKLHTLLRNRILLPPNSPVLMAVSGGQDSLCMARLLIDIQPQWNWKLGIIHCDHRWREDSQLNADHVLQLAEEWNVTAWCNAAKSVPGNEADARAWRYKTFADVARMQGYGYVVCGHTMSDRAETVLYHLIRGTGLDGIGTLPWSRPIDQSEPTVSLVRPLLSFSRQETSEFCQQHNLAVWEDSTNQSLNFRRNRIRQELLPYLREHFNPQVERALAQTLEITAAEVDFLERQTASIYKEVVTCEPKNTENLAHKGLAQTQSPHTWKIHQKHLREQPLAIQRRVIRSVLRHALVQTPNFQHIDKVVSLLQAPNGSQCDPLPGGVTAQVCKPFLLINQVAK